MAEHETAETLRAKLDAYNAAKLCQQLVEQHGDKLFVGLPHTVTLVPREDGSFYAGVLVGMCVGQDAKQSLELLLVELQKLVEQVK